MKILVVAVWVLAVIVGASTGWNFSQNQGWGGLIAFIVAVICAAVLGKVAWLIMLVVTVTAEISSDRAYERRIYGGRRSSYARQYGNGSSPKSAESAIESYKRRQQEKDNPRPAGGSVQDDAGVLTRQKRDENYWGKVREAEPLPPSSDL